MDTIGEIFNSLTGKWLLKRTIPSYGYLEGMAFFISDKKQENSNFQRLNYREDGICKLDSGKRA